MMESLAPASINAKAAPRAAPPLPTSSTLDFASFIDQPERGVIGIGDPPAIATAAAIANAVRNATGVTMRSIPLTPDKVLGEIERTRGTN